VGLALGLVVASAWAWRRTRNDLDAALEIDRRFGLKERVSSSFALADYQIDSPAARALFDDAVERTRRLDIRERFRIAASRWSLLPFIPATIALGLAFFWHPVTNDPRAEAKTASQTTKEQVKHSTEVLRKKFVDRKKEAQKQGLKSAEDLFDKLEAGVKKLAENKAEDRKQALSSLNDLAKQLDQRKQSLGGGQEFKDQLQQQMKQLSKGPADKFAEAMQHGDIEQAAAELDKLRDALKKGELDDKQREELARQMNEMKDKLKQASAEHQEREQQLQQQIAEERQRGNNAKADELQQKLNDVARQRPQMDALDQLANKLGQSAASMKQGDSKGAQAGLDDLSADLDNLQKQISEDAMLSDALDEIKQAKDAMNCKQCSGQGCEACKGQGQKIGQDKLGGRGGGIGSGRGRGFHDEPDVKTGEYDSRVKQKVGKGTAKVTDLVDGPNSKGKVEQEIRSQWQAVKGDAEDPLSEQHLPRDYREHTKSYFDSLREK
jgi:hypothetical protein